MMLLRTAIENMIWALGSQRNINSVVELLERKNVHAMRYV